MRLDHLPILPDRVELNPRDAMVLAEDCMRAGRPADAFELFRAVTEMPAETGNFAAFHGAGIALSQQRRHAEALPFLDCAMGVALTDLVMVTLNKSVALGEAGRSEEAIALLDGVLRMDPDHAHALYNRGVLRMQIEQFREALDDFEHCLRSDPYCANGDAVFCRGFANLVLGDYLAGFRDFERRLRDNVHGGPGQGEELKPGHVNVLDNAGLAPAVDGAHVLVLCEMGHGDMIQFGRFLPMLVRRGARVTAVVKPGVRPLFDGRPGITTIAYGDPLPEADFWCHMMGLAHVFEVTAETIPPPLSIGYDDYMMRAFRNVIPDDGILNVGLCWAGSTISRYDEHRTIPLALLEPIVDLARTHPVRFYGLQQDIRPTDLTAKDRLTGITHIGDLLLDFNQAAHAMKCLDLVITVDTSVLHMAGTVGARTWTLLTKFRTYWVWMFGHDTTPWYPSMKLIRQPLHGDWESAIAVVRDRLLRELED